LQIWHVLLVIAGVSPLPQLPQLLREPALMLPAKMIPETPVIIGRALGNEPLMVARKVPHPAEGRVIRAAHCAPPRCFLVERTNPRL
jgi:hypothetical protein